MEVQKYCTMAGLDTLDNTKYIFSVPNSIAQH